MAKSQLLSISEASKSLGVSEAALRQWTDEGKINAFVTPGGHRRYSESELRKFIGSHSRMLGVKALPDGHDPLSNYFKIINPSHQTHL